MIEVTSKIFSIILNYLLFNFDGTKVVFSYHINK
nr:MAG TPA: hypothetical protein [Caudoviricetes sp.]